tara:strand:+ start:306 stop:1001 length:696 start_codon:yes stop_codon:yes gene_type:complete
MKKNLLIMSKKSKLKFLLKSFLSPNCKYAFLKKLNKSSKILDIGCGNIQTAKACKLLVRNSYYCGIDIKREIKKSLSDKYIDNYIISDVDKFDDSIISIRTNFDAIICTHVIEHCEDRVQKIENFLKKLKKGGKLYLSFPSEESINFPSRAGTLNYFDDPTHLFNPPAFNIIINTLIKNNIRIEYKEKRYRPLVLFILGHLFDLICKIRKKGSIGVWEKWGFESIIIGSKI